MVYAPDLGSGAARRVGSSPTTPTALTILILINMKKLFILFFILLSANYAKSEVLSFNDLWLLKNKKVCVTEYVAIDNITYNIGDTLEILKPSDIGYYRFIIHQSYYPECFPMMYFGKKIIIEEFVVIGNKKNGFEVLCICTLENGEKIEVDIDRAILCEEVQKNK